MRSRKQVTAAPTIRVYDLDGVERDWNWVTAKYGQVAVHRSPATDAYRLVKLQESEGPAVYVVTVLDKAGKPQNGVRVVRWWPNIPPLPSLPPGLATWKPVGLFGTTEGLGTNGYGGGQGDYYNPKTVEGPSWFWPEGGDAISGMGFLPLTQHRHLDPTFQMVEGEGPPPEPPPEEELPETPTKFTWLGARLDLVILLLKQIIKLLKES